MSGHRLDLTGADARTIVWWRQGGACALCWQPMGPLESSDWEAHHRVRRRHLGWCPCNIVGLHARCHTQGPNAVHDQPAAASLLGLIVSPGDDPRDVVVPIQWPWVGDAYLDCEGAAVSTLSVHPLASPVQGALPLDP